MSPLVPYKDGHELLVTQYNRFHKNILYGDYDKTKEYREKLLGPDLVVSVPPEYGELAIIEKVGWDNWNEMDLEERGKITAYYRLRNMEEIMREWIRLQKQEDEARRAKMKNKK